MEASARVCPFCGEPPGDGIFCAACGRNLSQVEQLPTLREWERARAASPDPGGTSSPPSAEEAIAGFLATMHAAGDPGAERVRRTEPGFLGRTQHVVGWVVRPVVPGDGERRPRSGLFVSVDGRLHRLDSATQGIGYRGPVYVDVVGPEVAAPAGAELASDLEAVLRANGAQGKPPAR